MSYRQALGKWERVSASLREIHPNAAGRPAGRIAVHGITISRVVPLPTWTLALTVGLPHAPAPSASRTSLYEAFTYATTSARIGSGESLVAS